MSNRTQWWTLCLAAAALLFLSGNVIAANSKPPSPSVSAVSYPASQSPAFAHSAIAAAPLIPADVGKSDLMSQTFEFTGTFPARWQTYSAISQTISGTVTGDYFWSTTAYTSAEGTYSAIAMRGGVNGSVLTATATFTDPVDAWLVYGPVSLASVWQAELDWEYLYQAPVSSTANFTVAVLTDYDPVSRVGTSSGSTLPRTLSGWTAGSLDLSDHAGQSVYVAFRYQSPSGGIVSDGPFVDDVHLRANYRVFLPVVSKWTLTISKSAASSVWPGQSLVYTITVNNLDSSQSAYPVTIMDTVPANTTFAGADGTFDFFNGVVTWSGLTVPPGDSITQHLTVTVASNALGTPIVNNQYSVSVPPNPMVLFGIPVTTTVVGDFSDDFSNPASGWPAAEYDQSPDICSPPPGSWRAGYTGGIYGVATACDRAAQLYPAPVRLADTRNFTVEVDLRSNQADLWASSYGLFFNGSDDLHEVYTVELFQGQDPPIWELVYWPNFNWSDQIWPPGQILEHKECPDCTGADYAWNHVLVRRVGDVIEVYMGAGMGGKNLKRQAIVSKGTASGGAYNRVGLYHGNFEVRYFAPAGSYAYVFDNFLLSPAAR